MFRTTRRHLRALALAGFSAALAAATLVATVAANNQGPPWPR